MGQTVEKPWGCLEKLHPGEESEAMGFSEGKPEGAARGFAFGKSRGIQALPGEVFQTTPRLFNSLSEFGFLEVQGQTCPRALYGKS